MINYGDKVDVYRNLRTGGFSIRKKGKVVLRCKAVIVTDPQFIVSEKGRQRVLRDKQKNVHAVVRGIFDRAYLYIDHKLDDSDREAYYNPYITETFINKITGEPIVSAKKAILVDGKVYYETGDV